MTKRKGGRNSRNDRRVIAAIPSEKDRSFTVLDSFSEQDIRRWERSIERFNEYRAELSHSLEYQRYQLQDELLSAIRDAAINDESDSIWHRVNDYQFADCPLSVAGSLKNTGQRFNLPDNKKLWPMFSSKGALYVASDLETALTEKFPPAPNSHLSAQEVFLRTQASYTVLALRLKLNFCIDISDFKILRPINRILAKVRISNSVRALEKDLKIKPPATVIDTARKLQKSLLDKDWAAALALSSVPSNSQQFGHLVSLAGLTGIKYPSTRNPSGKCLAIFPHNFAGTESFVELVGPTPPNVKITRLPEV